MKTLGKDVTVTLTFQERLLIEKAFDNAIRTLEDADYTYEMETDFYSASGYDDNNGGVPMLADTAYLTGRELELAFAAIIQKFNPVERP